MTLDVSHFSKLELNLWALLNTDKIKNIINHIHPSSSIKTKKTQIVIINKKKKEEEKKKKAEEKAAQAAKPR